MTAGILVSCGNRIEDPLRRLPYYIDRTLNGTPAGELPVEQVSRFHVNVNLKTARALGITVPQSVLLQATEIIE